MIHIITGLDTGGAEKALYRLLKKTNKNAVVISLKSSGKIGLELQKIGIEVISLGLNFYNFPFVFYKLCLLLIKYKPSFVQTWLYHADLMGGVAAKLVGVNFVVWGIRTTELRKGSYLTAAIRQVSAWLSYWIPTKIVVVAEKAKEKHIKIGYDASKMEVIPNGFDLGRHYVSPSDVHALKQEIGLTQSALVIGCVGRFSQDKGQDIFIDAAGLILKQFPEIKFLMVGRGLEASNLQIAEWITQTSHPENFILVGERPDVMVCLKIMDVFCLPSRSEGFPNVLGEAMLAGVPCVSTDAGDAAILGGENVSIAEVDNSTDLANKLIGILEKSADERNELGRSLHQRIVDKYSVEKMVSRYKNLYKELEGERK